MEIWNDNSFPVWIDWIHFIMWPFPNGDLEKVKLEPDTIWDEGAPPPKAWLTALKNNRSIPPLDSKPLIFFFENDVVPSGYFLEMEISGCYFSGGL